MISFFRKFRRNLAGADPGPGEARPGRFYRYLRYAIGEIVLVVIGILIALQVNNWNEQKKQRQRFDELLVQVEAELAHNIENARGTLDFYRKKDSLIQIILFDSLSIEDYRGEQGFIKNGPVISDWTDTGIETRAFDELNQIDGVFKSEQIDLLYQLKEVYGEPSRRLLFLNEIMGDLGLEIHNAFKKQDFFTQMITRQPSEAEIIFYATDPEYKKLVAEYATKAFSGYVVYLEWFDHFSLLAFEKVFDYLEENGIQHLESNPFSYDPDNFNHLKGVFVLESSTLKELGLDSLSIGRIEERLVLKRHLKDSIEELDVIPGERHWFRTSPGKGYHTLYFDPEGQVSGLRVSKGTYYIKLKKINLN